MPSGSRRRRSCATRCGRSRRCRIGSRRWRPPSSAIATSSGLKLRAGRRGDPGLPGAERTGRRARRAREPRRRSSGRATARCSRRRIQQFYELRVAPPDIHVPAEPDEREALETLAVGARRAARAHRRAAARREARPRRSGEPQRVAGVPDRGSIRRPRPSTTRSRRCSAVLASADAAAARSSASTSRRFRAARPSRRWSSARTAACGAASIGSIGSGAPASSLQPRASSLKP